MSLLNLSQAYEAARFRAQLAEDQAQQLEELIAQWFLDGDQGARTFLREIAREYREAHPVRALESAPQQLLEESHGKGGCDDADEMRSDVEDVVEQGSRGSDAQGPGTALGKVDVDEGAASAVPRDTGVRVGDRAGAQEL